MDAFAQHIAAWQTFFITLAGMGATLAGLLFVAISLHPANQDEGAKTNLRRLAEHTFADLVQVLFIGVCFAAPGQPAAIYAITSVMIVVLGVRDPARRLWETWAGPDPQYPQAAFHPPSRSVTAGARPAAHRRHHAVPLPRHRR